MQRQMLEKMARLFESTPFFCFLGMSFDSVEVGRVEITIPFRPELIGNPEVPALHGGVISALLDTCGGAAVWSQLGRGDRVSTVDLRVDYLRPGRAETLVGIGHVIRLGNRVGVAELRAFHPGKGDEPVAVGTGVYNVRRANPEERQAL
jgi:uncharacterized protein (TIGR00369 family)